MSAKEKVNSKFKKIRFIGVFSFILIIVCISFTLVVQDVEVVRQIFFPQINATINSADDMEEWERISFNDKDHLIFDSIFWKKEIINHGNSENDIFLRVKDENGNVVVDEFQVSPGKSVKLDSLKKNEKYFFEIKATQGFFSINAT